MTTTNNTLAPTDADIIALADKTRTGEPGREGYILPISFARAVLSKWGAPVPVSHPVAAPEPHYGKGRYLGFARYNDAYSVAQVQAMLTAKTQPTTE